MQRFTAKDYRRMPWRNGGGTTTELVVAQRPDEARFLHRLSIADVASDGPFSRFEGYDRHIMLLDGAGMMLDGHAHGIIDLTVPLVPRSFSGDWNVMGTLVAGPVRDFNLIVDRARASSSLEVRTLATVETLAVPAGATCIVHVLEGVDAGDTLVADAPFAIGPGRFAIATVVPR